MAEENVEKAYKQLADTILEHNPGVDLGRVRAAFEVADRAHAGQKRKAGTPYVTHCVAAAEICAEMGLDEDSIVAALLHDCIEDTALTHEDIAKRFGEPVAAIVEGVAKLTRVVYTSKEEEQMNNLRKMLIAMVKDIRVILIKIADRLHNMRTMEYQSEAKQREKALETMELYTPIAHRLGMQKIKWELEDLSLKYLDPFGYEAIRQGLEQKKVANVEFLSHIQDSITQRLESVGIKCTVSGRVKHIYSIYRKMYGQNKQFSEVMDLFAFRVIVDDIAECYNVLGYIHEMYRPLPGHFKDYIGTPKPNMYQSLHTTVIGQEGQPFEVQIRTWEMHRTAEYGIAAHWKYKEGVQASQADEEKFAWVRRLLETQQESDSQDFFQALKVDLFADEVFVFTPQADVINLPAGSTPIDFAYNIHSAVGNSMTGAVVNGRIVPFSHVLQSGDIVEIITSKSSKGPSRDWLNMVKSSEARNKIRQWFKRERREENIVHGRMAFDSEMRRAGLSMADITNEAYLPTILKRLSFSSLDDMYAAIGYGGLSAQKTANKIKDILRQLEKTNAKAEEGIESIKWTAPEKPRKAVHGIVVEGLDNCLVKFSRCCTPVPGDDIAGFITRGYGVSIHRKDCPNYISSVEKPEERDRWVKVSWADTIDEKYVTTLSITARDRDGLVMDVATVLNGLKIKVNSLNARGIGDGIAVVFLTIEVANLSELKSAIVKLMNVQGVSEIKRSAQPGNGHKK
ncbi:MAG: bifunctional (p)ppGpp synthetase/guanosine-3',5'-bis(diphosphate) 3'-pyrophosphohydrolase [Oscillospiraceae bacterium]|nr:bifunctional (p)ppGpp synthetase/guanosine-3',5'-bis(diphosphate) 3'-pyrophosphohydrolase [Oscillospiraceae bacterium]